MLNILDRIGNGERPLHLFGKIAPQCGPNNEIESLRSSPRLDVNNVFGLRAFGGKIETCDVSGRAAFATPEVGEGVVRAFALT